MKSSKNAQGKTMPESAGKGRQGVGGNGNLRPVRDGNERSRGRKAGVPTKTTRILKEAIRKECPSMTSVRKKASSQIFRAPRWLRGPPRSLRSIINPEEVSIYRRMRKAVIQELRPKTPIEWILVNEFVNAQFSAMRYGTFRARRAGCQQHQNHRCEPSNHTEASPVSATATCCSKAGDGLA